MLFRSLAKDSLWKGVWGRIFTALGGIPVARGTADREALRTCIEVIEHLDEPVADSLRADLAAAAILSVGPSDTSDGDYEPDEDQSHAEEILSGGARASDDAVLEEEDEEPAMRAGEPDSGYDPSDSDDAPSPSDSNEDEGRDITESVVHDVLKKYPHAESSETA